jgi:hypothetical protein
MSNFCVEQGRTWVCGEAYIKYVAAAKSRHGVNNPAIGGTQLKKGHFWMDTDMAYRHTPLLFH